MKTNRYPVLRVVAIIYKVLGILLAILTVLGACIAPFTGGFSLSPAGLGRGMGGLGIIGGLVTGFIILLYGGFSALFLYAAGEVLVLLTDLEANTRATVELLERSRGS